MDLPLNDLPDDVDALKAMVLALAREQAAKEARLKAAETEIARLEAVEKSANERIANLTLIMKVLQRTQNGKRSERLRLGVNDEQVSFAFEEVETGLSAIQSELDRAAKDKPKRTPRPRKGFAAHLERIEEVIEPEIPAGCEGLEKVLIGEDRSERLDVVPPKPPRSHGRYIPRQSASAAFRLAAGTCEAGRRSRHRADCRKNSGRRSQLSNEVSRHQEPFGPRLRIFASKSLRAICLPRRRAS